MLYSSESPCWTGRQSPGPELHQGKKFSPKQSCNSPSWWLNHVEPIFWGRYDWKLKQTMSPFHFFKEILPLTCTNRLRSKRKGISDVEFLPKRRLQFLSQRLQAVCFPLNEDGTTTHGFMVSSITNYKQKQKLTKTHKWPNQTSKHQQCWYMAKQKRQRLGKHRPFKGLHPAAVLKEELMDNGFGSPGKRCVADVYLQVLTGTWFLTTMNHLGLWLFILPLDRPWCKDVLFVFPGRWIRVDLLILTGP